MDVSLLLTHDCNLGCTYCYEGEKFRKQMSVEVRERALDLAFADDATRVQVSFFGGEPLLEWAELVAATAAARARALASGKQLVLRLGDANPKTALPLELAYTRLNVWS